MTTAMWATLVISALMLVSALAAWREAFRAAKDAQHARFEVLRVARLMGVPSTMAPPSKVVYEQGRAVIYGYADPDQPYGFGGGPR